MTMTQDPNAGRATAAGATASFPLNVGLIGAGMIGQHRADSLRQVAELRLAAVADQREDLARQLAGAGGKTYADGLALAGDPDVRAVIISTPPASHEKLAVAALGAGKHVLVEKPMATDVAGCQRMVDAARANNVTLACGFNMRYIRATKLAKQMIAQGAIGELDHVRAFHGHRGGTDFGRDWITNVSATGGGSLMDNGIHLIDLCRYFLGDVVESKGYMTNHVWDKPGCEDNGYVLMRNAKGRIGTLHSTWCEWRGYGWRLEVYGTEGFIRFGFPPLHLVHGRRDGMKTKVKRYWFPMYQITERVKGWQWSLNETLAEEMREWARAIARNQQPPTTGVDGLEAVRIAKSAEFVQ